MKLLKALKATLGNSNPTVLALWILAMFGYVILPTIIIVDSNTVDNVFKAILWVVSMGSVIVLPVFDEIADNMNK